MVSCGPVLPLSWINCTVCGVDVCVEITTMESVQPRYLCRNGHAFWLVEFVAAPSMAMAPLGPAVPTPEDILTGAGLDPRIR